jgi:hypothetical protein
MSDEGVSNDLGVWRMAWGPDTVVAFDQDDAWAVWCATSGERREDYEPFDTWQHLGDDHRLTIWRDNAAMDNCQCAQVLRDYEQRSQRLVAMLEKLPRVAREQMAVPPAPRCYPNGHLRGCPEGADTRTCAEWARLSGRGFLCSTEA